MSLVKRLLTAILFHSSIQFNPFHFFQDSKEAYLYLSLLVHVLLFLRSR